MAKVAIGLRAAAALKAKLCRRNRRRLKISGERDSEDMAVIPFLYFLRKKSDWCGRELAA
jgi:hypothetical protein